MKADVTRRKKYEIAKSLHDAQAHLHTRTHLLYKEFVDVLSRQRINVRLLPYGTFLGLSDI